MHIEAISATSLAENYKMASDVIDRFMWDAVVLQEASFEPIPSTLTQNVKSDPQAFVDAVQTIDQGVHAAAPYAEVYFCSTWAPADTANLDATADGAFFSSAHYLRSLGELTVLTAMHTKQRLIGMATSTKTTALACLCRTL